MSRKKVTFLRTISRRERVAIYRAPGSKSPVAVTNYAGPKYFRSDFIRREMERREGGGEVGGREGSRSWIRVFAPPAAVDTSTRARHAWLVRAPREAPRIGGYILVSP